MLHTGDSHKNWVMNNLENIVHDDCFTISVADVKEAISKLKRGKASGCDHLSAEHFLYADPSICVLLYIIYKHVSTWTSSY